MDITETVDVRTRATWRAWLAKHHATKREIWLIYHKKGSKTPRVPYGEAVEEALCFGWIDSTVKKIDTERYAQRFTPRKKGSSWSTPNLIRVKRLVAQGLMTSAGAVHIPSRHAAKAYHAEHAKRVTASTVAPRDLSAALRENARAASLWKGLAPGYKRLYVRWVTEAKRPETRAKRVALSVERLAKGIKQMLG